MKTIEELKTTKVEKFVRGLELAEFVEITKNIDLDRLREICTAEREGQLKINPVKIGDILYIVYSPKYPADPEYKGKWFISESEVERILYGVRGLSIQTYPFCTIASNAIGKTTFLTKPEADKALAERIEK